MSERLWMLAQIVGSAAILALVQPNGVQLVCFLALWAFTFRRLSWRELALWVVAGVLFTALDYVTLRQGIFRFRHPDFLLMPCWEPFMWGFLALHCVRMVGGPTPGTRRLPALGLAVVLALPFLVITDQQLLFWVSAACLAGGLAMHHEPYDFAYVGYFMLVGVLWEHVGVWRNQWSYPGEPVTGVPPWFATMFGSIALALRRLVLPLLRGRAGAPSVAEPGAVASAGKA